MVLNPEYGLPHQSADWFAMTRRYIVLNRYMLNRFLRNRAIA